MKAVLENSSLRTRRRQMLPDLPRREFLKTSALAAGGIFVAENVEWAIENRAVYDFLSHPAVLCAKDPEFKAIDLICDLVKNAGDRAELVDLETIAGQMKSTKA